MGCIVAGLSQEEQALFLTQVADAAPLNVELRADLAPKPPKPLVRQQQSSRQTQWQPPIQLSDRLEGGEDPTYLYPGVSGQVLRDLRRGRWVVQREIDLHGHKRDAAREALANFLCQSLEQGLRCIRVVTGQGLRSPGQVAILRVLTRNWLAQCTEVLAYCVAKPGDGGKGALIVLLRNQLRPHLHDSINGDE